MTQAQRNVLIVSPDHSIANAIGSSLSSLPGVQVDREPTTLSEMNGRLSRVAGRYDVVLFQSSDHDAAEMDAIRTLNANRRHGSVVLALADSMISLAAARELTKAGVDEVLPLSGIAAEIGERMSRIAVRHGSVRPKSGKVIAIAKARGGAGASTLAVNLADQIACETRFLRGAVRRKVALLDLDVQFGSIGSMLDLPEQDAVFRMAKDGIVPDETFLDQSIQVAANGVSVVAAPAQFVPLDSVRNDQVAAMIDILRATHDFVVIDMPQAMVGWIEPIVARTDRLMLVADASVPAIRQCRRVTDFLTADNVALPVDIIVNRDRRPLFSGAVRKEAEKALGRTLEHWLPDDPGPARLAIDRGQPLAAVAGRARLTRAVGRLARAIVSKMPAAAEVSAS